MKKDWGVGDIQKEVQDDKGNLVYTALFQNTYPDILSGASSKAFWYQQPYYKELLEHFIANLSNAELLLVIGYGFGDDGINQIIETKYLAHGKKMIIIDIRKPDHRVINDYRSEIFEMSVSDITMEHWIEIKKNCG